MKLIKEESESEALRRSLAAAPARASSRLARVEVLRTAHAFGTDALERGAQVLANIALVPLDDLVLDTAARLEPLELRSLDAIHLASAMSLEEDLAYLITYDHRLLAAAGDAGVETVSPA